MIYYRIITLVPEHVSILLHNAFGLECTLWPLSMCHSRIWHLALNDQQYSSNSHPCHDRSCDVFLAGVYTPTDALPMLKEFSFGATKVLRHKLGCLWLSVAVRGCLWLLVAVRVCGCAWWRWSSWPWSRGQHPHSTPGIQIRPETLIQSTHPSTVAWPSWQRSETRIPLDNYLGVYGLCWVFLSRLNSCSNLFGRPKVAIVASRLWWIPGCNTRNPDSRFNYSNMTVLFRRRLHRERPWTAFNVVTSVSQSAPSTTGPIMDPHGPQHGSRQAPSWITTGPIVDPHVPHHSWIPTAIRKFYRQPTPFSRNTKLHRCPTPFSKNTQIP